MLTTISFLILKEREVTRRLRYMVSERLMVSYISIEVWVDLGNSHIDDGLLE
jgi:hypothetical protein